MNLQELVEKVRSGVFHIFYADANGKRIGSGSAFASNGYLITNGHVYDCPPNTEKIWIRRDEHTDQSQGIWLGVSDFQSRRITASPPAEYDYAVLNFPELKGLNPYQFQLRGHRQTRIGQQVVFLGYPFERNYLTAHTGIVSSLYQEAGTHVIQIDASVNQSNSGGPLLNCSTGEVLGVVTRKATGFTETFEILRQAILKNISMLRHLDGSVFLVGVNYIDMLCQSQQQVLDLLLQVERSANVGIGYAYSTDHMIEDPLFPESTL